MSEPAAELTDEIVRLAMAVDPDGFIGVRVRELAALWGLRSDAWLERAAEEIAMVRDGSDFGAEVLAILRRHRDNP